MERKKGREEEKESKEWGKEEMSVGSRERRKEGGRKEGEARAGPRAIPRVSLPEPPVLPPQRGLRIISTAKKKNKIIK